MLYKYIYIRVCVTHLGKDLEGLYQGVNSASLWLMELLYNNSFLL